MENYIVSLQYKWVKKETQLSNLRLVKNIISESIFKVKNDVDFSDWYSEEENELEVKFEHSFYQK